MPSFRRRTAVVDADRVDDPSRQDPERSTDADEALALAEEAEAEAVEAEAAAAAARARAKAIRLRRQAQTAEVKTAEPTDDDAIADDAEADDAIADDAEAADDTEAADDAIADDDAEADATEIGEAEQPPASSRRLRIPRIRWTTVAAALALLCTSALITLSVLMVLNHRSAVAEEQRTAEYAAAARQGVVTMMSLDFNTAAEDVQRIIDNTTGQFKQDFEAQAEDFAQVARDAKVVTEATVNEVAVKSMTETNATALVSATSRVTNSAGADQEPRSWRLLVDLAREGDQIKMSNVEFVP